jgi:hypothetical protein
MLKYFPSWPNLYRVPQITHGYLIVKTRHAKPKHKPEFFALIHKGPRVKADGLLQSWASICCWPIRVDRAARVFKDRYLAAFATFSLSFSASGLHCKPAQ